MSKIKSKSEILKSIDALKNERWPSYSSFSSEKEFMRYFQDKFHECFNLSMFYLFLIQNGLAYKYYRVRLLEDIKDPTIVREYSYPPKQFCKQNRANIPGNPIFYSSPSPSIALLETIRNNNLDPKKQYCISRWEMDNRDLVITPFVFGVKDEGYRNLAELILREKLPGVLGEKLLTEEQIEVHRLILTFLSDSFLDAKENNYSISSFIGHSHLYMPHKLQTNLFIYPSIQADRKAVNIAVSPQTVDTSMVMKYMLICNVTEMNIEQNIIKVDVIEYGVCDNGKVKIKPVHPYDRVYEFVYNQFYGT